jgi:transcriptional regulator with XRE-family HTH domain
VSNYLDDREMSIWLRNRRIQKKLTIEDIADRTGLWEHHLQAIERGEFDRLPGGMYNRAFMRQYAKALGVTIESASADLEVQPSDVAIDRYGSVVLIEARLLPRPKAQKPLTTTTDFLFALAEALLPPRLCREELGDAREFIGDTSRPMLARWVKVVSSLFWVGLNAIREYVGALAGK